MSGASSAQIYKATYSGVPVYEMLCRSVAVMRRRSDGWLNATQILKVVGLDKPQRTRVLEREVQKGTHEKVQGGYGKYQGTWVPLERGVELATQYNIQHLLEPITSYVPTNQSPPPAPKHVVAAPIRAKKVLDSPAPLARGLAHGHFETDSEMSPGVRPPESDGSMSPTPSDLSSTSRTPSPIVATEGVPEYFDEHDPSRRQGYAGRPGYDGYRAPSEGPSRYADIILDYFISESTQIPQLLINPPPDFDANMSVDDDEHTALHWACAMGRVRVVKLLLTAGADIFRVNQAGQTALMRSVMFANNYDLRKFPELFELLHRSVLNIDRNDRTVFHHVVDLALSKGKTHAARYYMETMIARLAEFGNQLSDILNFQDDENETPLTMAARARSKRLVRILLEHGADPKIKNKDGKSAEDYIVEDERFRASPPATNGANGASGMATAAQQQAAARLHHSESGQRAAGRCVTLMTELLHSLATSFDTELATTERNLFQASSLLVNIQAEIAESQRVVEGLKDKAQDVDGAKGRIEVLEGELKKRLGKRWREEGEKDVEEKEREVKRYRAEKRMAEGELLLKEERPADVVAKGGGGSSAAALLAPPASGDLAKSIAELRAQVAELRSKRSELFDKFVERAREQGTGKEMVAYRRLIGAGCGGLGAEEVDGVVNVLCEMLEDGGGGPDPTAAAAVAGSEGEKEKEKEKEGQQGGGSAA